MKVINKFLFHLLLVIVLATFGSRTLFAQELSQEAISKQMDYPWYDVEFQKMSQDQQWMTYVKSFRNKSQVIILKDIEANEEFEFENSLSHELLGNDIFITHSKDKVLAVFDLRSKNRQIINNCQQYFIDGPKTLLLIINNDAAKNYAAVRYDVNTGIKTMVSAEVLNYVSKEDNNLLMIQQKDRYIFHNFGLGIRKEFVCNSKEDLADWFFDPLKMSLTLIKKLSNQTNPTVEMTNLLDGQKMVDALPPVNIADARSFKILKTNNDKILFEVTRPPIGDRSSDLEPEIWKTDDSIIYPLKKIRAAFNARKQLILYDIKASKITSLDLGTNDYRILADDKILLLDGTIYQSYRTYNTKIDAIMIDLVSDEKHYVVRNFAADHHNLVIAPGKNIISYSLENRWHIYDIETLTDKVVKLSYAKDSGKRKYYSDHRYNFLQWISNKDFLIGTDRRLYSGDTLSLTVNCIFNGSADQTITLLSTDRSNTEEWKENKRFFFLRHIADRNTEIYCWQDNLLKKVYETENGIGKMTVSRSKLIFNEQNADLPTKIIRLDATGTKVLVQSNPEYNDYSWAKKKVISYKFKGKELKGILYYPVGFKPGKKYPMITYIYLQKSTKSKAFYLPNSFSEEGFDKDLLTLNGYFVLMPDIDQTILNPGNSAVACVEAAVKAVLKTEENIDSKSLGLIGHSYGGYETNFIVSQTDMFAAAVSGSGISDPIGWYFSMDWNMKKPEFWRFEDSVFHIGAPFFSNKKKNLTQSPLLFADRINTPLLIWTGKEDRHVDWEQSVTLHLALRNLQKTSTLLVYPKEAHIVMDKTRAKDLTNKVLDWFDHYLKKKKVAWIE